MTIAVVIPVLNEERTIAQTLAHSASLGFDELIVADGGSTDRTEKIVSEFQLRGSTLRQSSGQALRLGSGQAFDVRPPYDPQIPKRDLRPFPLATPATLMVVPPGRAQQMNAGALLSRSDVLVFLHADTLLPMNARSLIEETLRTSTCVGGRFDVRFDTETGFGRVISSMMNLRSRLTGIATGDQAIFVRRGAFEALRGFADIPIMEDVEFTRRLKQLGPIASLHSQVTTSYRRWKSHGPLRTVVLMWALRLLYWIGVSPTRLSHFYTMVR